MKSRSIDEPLAIAAVKGLRRAAKAAWKKAAETNTAIVVWENGKIKKIWPGRVSRTKAAAKRK